VDVKAVLEAVKGWDGVIDAKYQKYLCSKPSQEVIVDAVKKHNLNRVVIASCTPRMHLPTFQNVLERAGLNPYMLEFVNIREQDSWVHGPKPSPEATKKAISLIRGGYEKSRELEPLASLSEKSSRDILIVGGGIANNFIAAAGHPVGKSLWEPDLLDDTRALVEKAKARGAEIPLPEDVVVATELSDEAEPLLRRVENVGQDELILDVGPRTAEAYARILAEAGTIVWNGPVGVFEKPAFADGTRRLAQAVASSDAFSIAGGGDTIAALDRFGLSDRVSYISTGGGAFLEFLEGKTLPAVAALEARARDRA